MKLLVVTPILYSELTSHVESLYISYNNLREAFNGKCIFLLVVQSKVVDEVEWSKQQLESKLESEVVMVDFLNVSRARNLGIIKSKSYKCSHIIFHDCSLTFPLDSCHFFYKYANGAVIPKLKVSFSNEIDQLVQKTPADKKLAFDIIKINPIYDSYVWSFIFKVENLTTLFDESIGLGSNTYYKSGEDVLFLFYYFSLANSYESLESKFLHVNHPARSADFAKHLIYAEGQGYLFRNLLCTYPSLRLVKDLFLFFTNALFRVFMFKNNSFPILKLRLRGFFLKNRL